MTTCLYFPGHCFDNVELLCSFMTSYFTNQDITLQSCQHGTRMHVLSRPYILETVKYVKIGLITPKLRLKLGSRSLAGCWFRPNGIVRLPCGPSIASKMRHIWRMNRALLLLLAHLPSDWYFQPIGPVAGTKYTIHKSSLAFKDATNPCAVIIPLACSIYFIKANN